MLVSGGEELKEVTASKIVKILQKMIENHLLPWNPRGGHIRAKIFVIRTNLKNI